MTEPADAPRTTHLDELAAVTKEYATYSRAGVGVPLAVVGAWMLATPLAGAAASAEWAMVSFVLTPAVWLVASRSMRGYYQRHGRVSVPDDDMGLGKTGGVWAGFARAALLLEALAFALEGGRWAASGPPTRWVGYVIGMAGLLFGAWAAPRWTRDTRGGVAVFSLAGMTFPSLVGWGHMDSGLASTFELMVAAAGVPFAAAGVAQHLRCRRLERRLAALKGGA